VRAAKGGKPPSPRKRHDVAKGSKRSPPRQKLQRTEEETRRDLGQFIDLVTKTAAASTSCEKLTKDEREWLIRQRNIFSSSVAELTAILADHHHEHVREHRLYKLFEALGSACVLAHLGDPIRDRLRTTPASDAKKGRSQRIDSIIADEAAPFWRGRPSYKPWRVAGEIRGRLNQRLRTETLPVLEQSAIAHRLDKLRSTILTVA
jgi:hypothetical protein